MLIPANTYFQPHAPIAVQSCQPDSAPHTVMWSWHLGKVGVTNSGTSCLPNQGGGSHLTWSVCSVRGGRLFGSIYGKGACCSLDLSSRTGTGIWYLLGNPNGYNGLRAISKIMKRVPIVLCS